MKNQMGLTSALKFVIWLGRLLFYHGPFRRSGKGRTKRRENVRKDIMLVRKRKDKQSNILLI